LENLTTQAIIAAVLVLGTAALVRSSFGFGDALLAMPLLTIALGVARAVPLVGLVSVVMTVVILLSSWQSVDVLSVKKLTAGALIGVPAGILLLKQLPEEVLTRGLGVVVVAFGLYRLLAPRPLQLQTSGWAVVFGFTSGCLGGAFNIGGPPIVLYGSMRGWTPERFRATLQGYFLITSIVIGAGQGIGGLWTANVWRLFFLSMPAVFAGLWLGRLVHSRIDPRTFGRLLSLLLIALGILVFI
jgi:uncharacterized membrane protein YfcA